MRIEWHCVCGDVESAHMSRPDREQCYGHCQGTPRSCETRGYRPIDHAERAPAFYAMLAKAQELFLPKAYTCDLSTDYQALHGDDAYTGSFLWVLRSNGTEFYRLDGQAPTDLAGSKTGLDYWTRNERQAHIFHWDGECIAPVDYQEARNLINQAYREVVKV